MHGSGLAQTRVAPPNAGGAVGNVTPRPPAPRFCIRRAEPPKELLAPPDPPQRIGYVGLHLQLPVVRPGRKSIVDSAIVAQQPVAIKTRPMRPEIEAREH